jgi:flagellar FliL protein
MLTKLLPIIFLILGVGAGIGAGIFVAPGSGPNGKGSMGSGDTPHGTSRIKGPPREEAGPTDTEFVKMNNQFVVPVVEDNRIAALVVVSLSLETQIGLSEQVYAREPRLRDGFLRVMFDHANMSGFQGAFTDPETLNLLRAALWQVAQNELGSGVLEVLIVDIIRQDT